MHLPILLHEGTNHLFFRAGRGAFKVRLYEPPSPVFLHRQDVTVHGTPADVDLAVEAADRAFARWRWIPAVERADYLHEVARKMREIEDQLARQLTLEGGLASLEELADVFPRTRREAIAALSAQILVLQGNGDYEGAAEFTESMGIVSPELYGDLRRLSTGGIPVDVTFEQGPAVLGIAPL